MSFARSSALSTPDNKRGIFVPPHLPFHALQRCIVKWDLDALEDTEVAERRSLPGAESFEAVSSTVIWRGRSVMGHNQSLGIGFRMGGRAFFSDNIASYCNSIVAAFERYVDQYSLHADSSERWCHMCERYSGSDNKELISPVQEICQLSASSLRLQILFQSTELQISLAFLAKSVP